jgi:hypothetical protein
MREIHDHVDLPIEGNSDEDAVVEILQARSPSPQLAFALSDSLSP